MIPKSYRGDDLIGRKVRCSEDIQNRGGQGIAAGATAEIRNVVRGKGITIKTDKCPCCGQYAYITGVSRNELTLIENTEKRGDVTNGI